MPCFWKSGGKYVISTGGVKQTTPTNNHNGHASSVYGSTSDIPEAKQRRSGIRAPVINVDETKESTVKHQKSTE